MQNSEYPYLQPYSQIQSFMCGVYCWMSCALVITAATAYYIALQSNFFLYLSLHPGLIIVLFFAQLALVITLVSLLQKINFVITVILFLVYSIMTGITLSTIFYLYTIPSIITTFITTAGMFGTMSVYGYMTKTDLTAIGNMSIMMLVGLILGGLTNLFFQSSMFDFILSGIGVVVFTLLTAYDVQKIKQIGQQVQSEGEIMAKFAIVGALTLYLDFINLFLYLLRFMGTKRES
jgi:FtsH-binding integral membrane protein